jgi:parallel beta-helix repeat protein
VSGGPVNLTNLAVNGEGFGGVNVDTTFFVGILYQGSSGTINQVITTSQNNNAEANVTGFGMWIQGGSSKPSVTVENSSMHDFTQSAVFAVGTTTASDLTVTIKNNNVSSSAPQTSDLVVEEGTDPTVSGNVVYGGFNGIYVDTSTGSIMGNTVIGSLFGISLGADGAAVKLNNIFDTINAGIDVGPNLEVSVVEDNTIRTANLPGYLDITGIGIQLNCNKVKSGLMNSNTLLDLQYGYQGAAAGFSTSNNTYVGVVTEIATCGSAGVSSKASAVPRLKLLGQLQEQ